MLMQTQSAITGAAIRAVLHSRIEPGEDSRARDNMMHVVNLVSDTKDQFNVFWLIGLPQLLDVINLVLVLGVAA
jgi:hypothetical protein